MKRLFYTSLVVLSLALLFLPVGIGIASAQDVVLRLDEGRSYVVNLETYEKISYEDFLNTARFEGVRFEFHLYVGKTGSPIPDDYVLELRTNMNDPEWKFGDVFSHSANWIVWKREEEHARMFPSPIILSGDVPQPIRPVKEPGFEAYDIKGIGKGEVYAELTVGTTKDGATLETIIQKLEPSMEFLSTNRGIQQAKREMDENFAYARSKIGENNLERDIQRLYEEGHPGWASKLSKDYKELSAMVEAPPIVLYVLLSVILGLILGSAFVYVYVSRGGGKGVDVTQISSELKETSGRIEDKSSSINAISTRFARSEDEEKRSVARDLIRIRASLNEISNEIRAIADRIKER